MRWKTVPDIKIGIGGGAAAPATYTEIVDITSSDLTVTTSSSTFTKWGQTFTMPGAGTDLRFSNAFFVTSPATGTYRIEVWSTSSGVPNALIGNSADLNMADIPIGFTTVYNTTVEITGLTLTSGGVYWIGTSHRSGFSSFRNYCQNSNTYAGGQQYSFSGSGWSSYARENNGLIEYKYENMNLIGMLLINTSIIVNTLLIYFLIISTSKCLEMVRRVRWFLYRQLTTSPLKRSQKGM